MSRPPFDTFTGPICKGSYALGSACGHCERCAWEPVQMGALGMPQSLNAPPKDTSTNDRRCYEQDVEAPRVGCGCRECYQTRERNLDPRLLELASTFGRSRWLTVKPSHALLDRCLVEYLSGRVDYAALHLGIIKALMELADKQFEQTMEIVSRQGPSAMVIGRKS